MQRAKQGDLITVHYIGTLDNGKIFDQRDGDQPLSFTIGSGEVFPALEQGVVGMAAGEVRNIFLDAEQAYGLRLEENLLNVSRQMFPDDRKLQVGQKLSIALGGTEQQLMRIRKFDDKDVLLDGNHDLAGCELTFALELVKIG